MSFLSKFNLCHKSCRRLWLVAGIGALYITIDPGTVSAQSSVFIQWTNVHQQIDGFGASSAWRGNWSTALAEMFFSTNSGTGTAVSGSTYAYTGIGLSLLRTRVAPGGTTVESGLMQMAQARGARVWSAPWSPPTTFKTANANSVISVNGGGFNGTTGNYQAYAAQLAGYVAKMKTTYGVNLYALSVQNEPNYNTTAYESCVWSGQQIHDFVPYLSAALTASNQAAVKIILPENESWTASSLTTTPMNDAAVSSLVSIVADHNYVADNNAGDQTTPAALSNYGKALWETEVSKLTGNDSSIADGVYWAGRVHLFLTAAQANAWHFWWLCSGGTAGNQGLCDTNDVPAKRLYTLGNFSRFVRPGYYRIEAANNTGALQISAYKNTTDGKFAIVVVNPVAANVTQIFNLTGFSGVTSVTPWVTSATDSLAPKAAIAVSGGSFTNTIPATSVVTFTGQAGVSAPGLVLGTVTDRAINAGSLLIITNTASYQ